MLKQGYVSERRNLVSVSENLSGKNQRLEQQETKAVGREKNLETKVQ